jgi:hypothetical protein
MNLCVQKGSAALQSRKPASSLGQAFEAEDGRQSLDLQCPSNFLSIAFDKHWHNG